MNRIGEYARGVWRSLLAALAAALVAWRGFADDHGFEAWVIAAQVALLLLKTTGAFPFVPWWAVFLPSIAYALLFACASAALFVIVTAIGDE